MEKARELVATLESNGWVCTETIIDDGNDTGMNEDTAANDE